MDKALEERLRIAISKAQVPPAGRKVMIDLSDARRLLYRMIKENSKGNELEYRKPAAHRDPKRK